MKLSKDVESYKDVQSYISYYQLTQYLPGAWEDDIEHMELNKDRAARQVSTVIKLKKCVEMVAKGSSPIVLSFGLEGVWGHAVVADKYEAGDFDKKYNSRIRYYDSNYPEDSKRYLYINSKTGDWFVEQEGIKSSDPKAYLQTLAAE